MFARQVALSTLLLVACTGCSLSTPRPGTAPPSQEPSSQSAGQPAAPPTQEGQGAYREAAYPRHVEPSSAPPAVVGQPEIREAAYQEGGESSAVPPSPDYQVDEGDDLGDQPMAAEDAGAPAAGTAGAPVQEEAAGQAMVPPGQDALAADEDLGQAPDGGQVDLGFFYGRLAPLGHWVLRGSYGWVWIPAGVAGGWRPYSRGHWVLTRYGWTWISSERFGWATYHYGRWVLDADYGWIWVPGFEWGPAWVCWREGGGFIGWAPLPPAAGAGIAFTPDVEPAPAAFSFVDERSFLDPGVTTHLAPASHNEAILGSTARISRQTVVNGRVVNQGVPALEHIEQVTGRKPDVVQVASGASSTNGALPGRAQMSLLHPRSVPNAIG